MLACAWGGVFSLRGLARGQRLPVEGRLAGGTDEKKGAGRGEAGGVGGGLPDGAVGIFDLCELDAVYERDLCGPDVGVDAAGCVSGDEMEAFGGLVSGRAV